MNGLIQTIFKSIADKFGLTIQQKQSDLEYYNTDDISITAALASRIAITVLMDSDINISGDSERAKVINSMIQELEETQLKTAVEVALGTGDAILKPYTDGRMIGYNIIPANEFVIVDAIGRHIKDCIIKCDEIQRNNSTYMRVERHTLNGADELTITQYAYKDGAQVPINAVKEWAEIEPEVVIPNVDRLLIGRIKCPTVNRNCLNSKNGVPITYGLGKVTENAKKSYNRFNEEMDNKEAMLFVDKTLLEKDASGKRKLPKKKLFQKMRGGVDSNELIHEYSPAIRDASLKEGIDQNLRMIELLTGLSSGVLTDPRTRYATATEIRKTLQMTFAYVQSVRNEIKNAINDLVNGTAVIMNMNSITPMGDYEIIYNWSDSYIEDMTARMASLMQGEAIGAVSKAEVRAYMQNEPLDIAEKKVGQIKPRNVINDIE